MDCLRECVIVAKNSKFFKQLGKFIEVVDETSTKEFRSVGLAGLKGVMLKTPVDNGTARANWNVGVNTIDNSTGSESSSKAKKNLDPSKFNEGSREIDSVKIGDTLNISNSMPYVNRLEYDDGVSTQGSGMVRRTLAELKSALKKKRGMV